MSEQDHGGLPSKTPATACPDTIPGSGSGLGSSTTSSSQTTLVHQPPYSTKTTPEKIFIITLTGLAMVLSMIPTNIVLPVLPILQHNYAVSTTSMNLLVTVFSLVQGLTPALMSSVSDLQGRRIAWMLALTIYTAANIGLACQNSYTALIILRCIQAAGSSCAIPFGFAVAADLSSPEERGRYIGPLQGCVMGAFAFGPVIGGLLEPSLGWRSIFWFLSIGSGVALLGYFLVIPETARTVVGNGSVDAGVWWRRPMVENIRRRFERRSNGKEDETEEGDLASPKNRIGWAEVVRAFTILAEKDALILVIFTSLFYAGVTALWASTGSHFGTLYNLSTLEVGFAFLPYGIAGGIGSIISGKLLDFNYRRLQKQQVEKHNVEKPTEDMELDFPYETARLQISLPFALLSALSLIVYGWIIETHQSLACALVLQALIGVGGTPLLGTIYTLLIDLYPTQAVATQGAADLVRCWLGAIAAAVIDYMLGAMGWGWSFTIFGVAMLIAMPGLGVVYCRGGKWRRERRVKMMKRDESGQDGDEEGRGS